MIELLSGEDIQNRNRSSNMLRGKFYVCPVCGNVIRASGEALVSCCGITLPPLEPEEADAEHLIRKEIVEDEYYVTVDHPMTKDHYISFLAAVSDQAVQFFVINGLRHYHSPLPANSSLFAIASAIIPVMLLST